MVDIAGCAWTGQMSQCNQAIACALPCFAGKCIVSPNATQPYAPPLAPLRAGASVLPDVSTSYIVPLYLGYPMIFAALGSGTPYSKDKEKGRKHMMISMGMSRFAYYAGNFLFNSIFAIGSSILWIALLFGINNRFVAYNDPAPLIFLVFFCVVLADLWSCTFAVLTPSFEAYSAFIFLVLMTLFPVRLAI